MKDDPNYQAKHCLGEAMAGHAYRATGHRKAEEYENMMTVLVNTIIAEAKNKSEVCNGGTMDSRTT